MKKYIIQCFEIQTQRSDSATYDLLFNKIEQTELEISAKKYKYEYEGILKRKNEGRASVYHILFKKT
tara:strand:+ start:1609 stop:1809 length:201 start_codon:yes stop_codon:yes gene_type:complete